MDLVHNYILIFFKFWKKYPHYISTELLIFVLKINQSTNQSINQTIPHSINQTINQSIYRIHSINHTIGSQSMSRNEIQDVFSKLDKTSRKIPQEKKVKSSFPIKKEKSMSCINTCGRLTKVGKTWTAMRALGEKTVPKLLLAMHW